MVTRFEEIIEQYTKSSRLSKKNQLALERALKDEIATQLPKALMHGYQMNKENVTGALETAGTTLGGLLQLSVPMISETVATKSTKANT